jgi:aspartyl-tRNA(Asn)/glutamyl-tRNA(Gln) amidotransferase subunit A
MTHERSPADQTWQGYVADVGGHDAVAGEMPSAVEAAAAVQRGDYTASALLERCIAEIEAHDDVVNAFVHTDFEGARRAAAQIDETMASGGAAGLGPWAGVPFGVKDLEDCAGMPTTRGSLLYRDDPPAEADSLHVARLRAAGAIPLGKTATPEFGTLGSTHSKALGVTRNAWDPTRTPGGSSGGSAAAVAAGMVPFATASDGGGSTRIPAAFSGLVGMKPSYGRIPRPSPDPSQTAVLGIEATTVVDAARHLDTTAGPDDIDRLSLPAPPVSYEEAIEHLDIGALRVGWSPDLGFAIVDPEVADLTRAAAESLAQATGTRLVDYDVRLPNPIATFLGTRAFGLWLDIDEHEHYPHRLDDMTPVVANGLRATYDRPLRTLVKPFRRRLELERQVAAIYEDIDVLLTPTTAVPAFAADGSTPTTIAGEDLVDRFGFAAPAMSTPFTMLANVCWNPACSVPAGITSEGLPVGLQIQGRRHADDVVLRLARLFEQAHPWPRHAPIARPT